MRLSFAALLTVLACGGAPAPSLRERPGELVMQQGQQMQGQQMQGQQMQGASLNGAEQPVVHSYTGASLANGRALKKLSLEQGTLVGTGPAGRTYSGQALVGTLIPAQQGDARLVTRISSATPDPTFPEGGTWLYGVDVLAADGSATPLCRPDLNGVSAAIPVAATFNTHGDRVESTTQFTFGCTAGVVAKCYRWGYKPWLTGDDDFAALHWACTRMARADYCGDGTSGTFDGTWINLWDSAGAPGPFNSYSAAPGYLFEAGWSTRGAVCLSKQRWLTLPPDVQARCPDRLIAPGAATGVATVCDTQSDVALFDSTTELFDESQVNVK